MMQTKSQPMGAGNVIKIQAQISLKEWQKYQNGEEAIAYNRTTEKEQYMHIVFNEQDIVTINEEDILSFTIKKEC